MFIAGTSVLDVDKAREPVRRCLQQAASAAGISVEIAEYTPNAARHNDKYLRAEFLRRMRSDPRQLVSLAQDGKGSSGWIVPRRAAGQGALQNRPGRVSQALPAIHPTSVSAVIRPTTPPRSPDWPMPMRPPVQCWTELSLSPRRPWTQPLTPI
jgi:hypothetical protein